MKWLVMTKSKKMNNYMLDLQIVNNNKEELEKRVEEIITKILLNGDKKEIIAFTDFELWKFGELKEDYTEFKEDKVKLIDYSNKINEAKIKILKALKEETENE